MHAWISLKQPIAAIAQLLDCPPTQSLADELGDEQPVIRYFVSRFSIGFGGPAVVEIVSVQLHRVVGIDFRRYDLRLFLIAEPGPAALAIPVLTNLLTVLKPDFQLDRHDEVSLAMQRHIGLV